MPSIRRLGPVEDEDFSSQREEDPIRNTHDPETGTRIGSDADANEKAATATEPNNVHGGSDQSGIESGDEQGADSSSSPNVVVPADDVENASEGGATPVDNANDDDDDEAPVPGTEALHDTYWNEERSTPNDGASQTSDGSDDDNSTSSSSSETSDSSDDSESESDANVDTDTGDDNPTDTDPESLQKNLVGEPLSEDDDCEHTSITDQVEQTHNESQTDSELEDLDPAPIGAVVVPYGDEYESGIEASKDEPTNLTREGDASLGISGVTEEASIDEEADKRRWRRLLWMTLVLVGTVVIIAALVGGLVGALYYKRSSPAAATTSAPSKAPTPSPSLRPTLRTLAPSTTFPTTTFPTTAFPTPVGTTVSEVTESPTSTVTTPTPTTSPSLNGTLVTTPPPSIAPSGAPTLASTSGIPVVNITNEALFLVIANLSADGGAAIRRPGTPQNQAFLSVQAEADQLGVQPQAALDTQSQFVQRYALRTFFYSTNGPIDWINRTNWENSTVNECLWYSQPPSSDGTMCNADNVVQVLAFKANGVTGQLPPELSMLTGLASLSIEGVKGVNGLTGGIPSTLASLTGMTDLVLQYHQFNDSFPPGLWNAWSGANFVTVADCNAPGFFPDVSKLTSVALIDLSGNRLRGLFPSGLSNFTSLVALNVANNKLRGPLTFDTMPPRIKLLNTSSNAFTGSIPSSVGRLTTLKQGLDLSHNQLTGTIPSEINNLINLKELILSFNLLTGTLPGLTNLTQLSVLELEGNNLTGVVSNATCNALASSGSINSVTTDCNPDGSGAVLCPCCTACCLQVLTGECQWSPAT